jgi:hypothetical protein
MDEEDDDDFWKPRGFPYAETGSTRKREEYFHGGHQLRREPSFHSSWGEIVFLKRNKRVNKCQR